MLAHAQGMRCQPLPLVVVDGRSQDTQHPTQHLLAHAPSRGQSRHAGAVPCMLSCSAATSASAWAICSGVSPYLGFIESQDGWDAEGLGAVCTQERR